MPNKHSRPATRISNLVILALLLVVVQVACGALTPRSSDTPSPTGRGESRSTDPTPIPTGSGESSPATKVPATKTAQPLMSATSLPPQVTATTPTPPPRTRYTISADFKFEAHTLSVYQEVAYTNKASQELKKLVFVVEPNRYEEAFWLRGAWWEDGHAVEEFSLRGCLLEIPLPSPLLPGQTLKLRMAYELQIPERVGAFGFTEWQTNLGDWYPFIPPYQEDEGWVAHEPSFHDYGRLGEHLVYESADFEVRLNLGEAREGVTVVGSAPVEREGNIYRFSAQGVRNFTFSASGRYVVREVTQDGVAIRSAFFPEDTAAGEAALTVARESLAIYGEVFTPYQGESFTVVEATFKDGMEYDGLVYVGSEYYRAYDSTPYNYLTLITAHETAHQWWYGLVGNDQALEPWLDEILATYSEQIYLEHTHPEAAGWWFDFRVAAYQPEGWVNGTIYDFDGFRPYINAVYLRGATFLGELREKMGEEAFFDFLASYAESNRHEIASGEDFWSTLEKYEVEGLESLVAEYFE
ncbi:MAG: hypothetical protein MAG431_00817 [Chloroflexi bacterium]|nr:hypothetical protein [Chloroflexota bacterium]